MQTTFVIIKPDALDRGLMGEIIRRFEQKLFRITRMELRSKTAAWCAAHYAQFDTSKDDEREIYVRLQAAMIYTPLVGIVLQGLEAIPVVRRMVGFTNSTEAIPGTIRGDFGSLPIHCNLIHASESPEAARREIDLFFCDGTNWN